MRLVDDPVTSQKSSKEETQIEEICGNDEEWVDVNEVTLLSNNEETKKEDSENEMINILDVHIFPKTSTNFAEEKEESGETPEDWAEINVEEDTELSEEEKEEEKFSVLYHLLNTDSQRKISEKETQMNENKEEELKISQESIIELSDSEENSSESQSLKNLLQCAEQSQLCSDGQKQFKCHKCSRKYTQERYLFHHLENYHHYTIKRIWYECEKCPHQVSFEQSIMSHLRMWHLQASENDYRILEEKKVRINYAKGCCIQKSEINGMTVIKCRFCYYASKDEERMRGHIGDNHNLVKIL